MPLNVIIVNEITGTKFVNGAVGNFTRLILRRFCLQKDNVGYCYQAFYEITTVWLAQSDNIKWFSL